MSTYVVDLWRCAHVASGATQACNWSAYAEATPECPRHGSDHMETLGPYELGGEG